MKNKEKSSFNPEAWQEPSEQPAASKISKVADISSLPGTVSEDIETITYRIEAARVDITAGYDNWRDLGFALSSELGENGRSIFHRISCFNPDYNQQECDKQYDKCLRSHGTGITKSTFFQKAKDAGIDVHTGATKSPKSPKPPKSPHNANGDIGEIGDSGETPKEPMPTFSQDVEAHLPDYLKQISEVGESPQEKDALVLCAITVLSSCLPHIYGIYRYVKVYPNLFYFLTARASSGKGQLSLCRHLVLPIHRRMKEAYKEAFEIYEEQVAEWEGKDRKTRGPKPKKPAQSMLIIPANTSATAVYQLLNDNDGKGLIFETEGDTLANTFESDFGNFSDGFRKAFHHEPITYHRRANDEDVEIESPQLSTVLTGTPRQVISLIKDAENGLFSRFMFYRLESRLEWKDVISEETAYPLDEQFREWGRNYVEFFDQLSREQDMHFCMTPEQGKRFNEHFSRMQTRMVSVFEDDIVASVRRLGLICFRIAMILSALRIWETGDCSPKFYCTDEDFDTALTMIDTLSVHTAKVFGELASTDTDKLNAYSKGIRRQKFFEALPAEFDRQDYIEVAQQTGTPPSTAEKWVRALCSDSGPLEKVEHGRYRKK